MPPRNTYSTTRRSHRILRALREGARVRIADVREAFDLAYAQAREDLKLLEELYELETEREGRTKVWVWPNEPEHGFGGRRPPVHERVHEREGPEGSTVEDVEIHLEVAIRYSDEFERRPLDGSQKCERDGDRMHVFAKRPLTPALESFVMSLVPDVEIHAPDGLRRAVERRLRAWLDGEAEAGVEG